MTQNKNWIEEFDNLSDYRFTDEKELSQSKDLKEVLIELASKTGLPIIG